MKKLLTTTSALALLLAASSTQAAIVFSSDMEGHLNTDDDTLASYDKHDPLPTGWIDAKNGFGNDRAGLNLVGTNTVYSFRYTNSGLTTIEGVIGALTAGTTYTISFDVSLDDGGASPYDVALATFASEGIRTDMTSISAGTSSVLATVSGSWDGLAWTASGGTVSGSTITFTYTADGTEGALGQDLAVRIDGATTSANIDNVSVDVVGAPIPEPGSLALLGLGGLLMIKRRRNG